MLEQDVLGGNRWRRPRVRRPNGRPGAARRAMRAAARLMHASSLDSAMSNGTAGSTTVCRTALSAPRMTCAITSKPMEGHPRRYSPYAMRFGNGGHGARRSPRSQHGSIAAALGLRSLIIACRRRCMRPAFPHAAPPAPMLVRRVQREREVNGRDRRQCRAPPARDAIEAQGRLQGQRHQRPGRCTEPSGRPRSADASAAAGRGRSPRSRAPCRSAAKANSAVARRRSGLIIGRMSPTDAKGAQAARRVRSIPARSGPAFSVGVPARSRRSIRRESTRCRPAACNALAPDQHATAGRRRRGTLRTVDPGKRIEQLEKEDEGRNQCALGQNSRSAALPSASASTSPSRSRPLDDLGQRFRRVDDVGIGEQRGSPAAAASASA